MSDEGDPPGDAPEVVQPAPPLTKEDLRRPGRMFAVSGGVIGLAAVLVAALVIASFFVGRATAPDQAADVVTGGPQAAAPFEFPVGDADRSGYWAFGGVTVALVDTFDRPDAERLGRAPNSTPWEEVSGTWGIEDDRAAGEGDRGERPGLAVIAGGSARRLSEVTMMVVERGAGLVFRYADRDNFWAMTAADEAWAVLRVVDGEVAVLGSIRREPIDGSTISVSQNGASLQFFVDGTLELDLEDPALMDERRSGLLSPADGGIARWDRFLVGDLA